MCFRPVHRLRQAGEFGAVFACRRVLRGTWFNLHYCANSQGSARLGLVIPKRNARRAVQRNAIRRVIRECFRGLRSELPCYDLVFRLTRSSPKAEPHQVDWKSDVEILLARLPRNESR